MLHECINLEIKTDDTLGNLTCLYRLELNLELAFTKNQYPTVVIADFNAKSQN